MTLDLSTLPPARRSRVLDAYQRERAAVRIREVYPVQLARFKEAEAFRRTAAVLVGEGYRFVTSRWVQSVIREGR